MLLKRDYDAFERLVVEYDNLPATNAEIDLGDKSKASMLAALTLLRVEAEFDLASSLVLMSQRWV